MENVSIHDSVKMELWISRHSPKSLDIVASIINHMCKYLFNWAMQWTFYTWGWAFENVFALMMGNVHPWLMGMNITHQYINHVELFIHNVGLSKTCAFLELSIYDSCMNHTMAHAFRYIRHIYNIMFSLCNTYVSPKLFVLVMVVRPMSHALFNTTHSWWDPWSKL